MYFSQFPLLVYDSVGNGDFKLVTHLLKRVAIHSKAIDQTSLFDTYDIANGETPESIADKLYDDPELHWIVLMVNDITDRYHQWPMLEQQFNTFVEEKYSNPDGVHHYEISQSSGNDTTKIEVYNNSALYSGDTDFYSTSSTVTNREYEEREQDKKRQIRLLDPRFVDTFVEEFKRLMKESVL